MQQKAVQEWVRITHNYMQQLAEPHKHNAEYKQPDTDCMIPLT